MTATRHHQPPGLDAPVSLDRVLGPFRRGAGDPTSRRVGRDWWLAWTTPDGPVGAHLVPGDEVTAHAWGAGAQWFLVLVVGGLLVALWPPVLNRAIALLFRLLRREPLEHDLSLAAVALSTMWFTLSWLAGGASIWVMATSLADAGADPGHLALVSICGYLLAAGIGMFSFVVPAGVGVRDGVLVVLLATSMPVAAATAVVVVARFYSVVADVAWAGIGWLWARAHHLLPDPKVDTHV